QRLQQLYPGVAHIGCQQSDPNAVPARGIHYCSELLRRRDEMLTELVAVSAASEANRTEILADQPPGQLDDWSELRPGIERPDLTRAQVASDFGRVADVYAPVHETSIKTPRLVGVY